MKNSNVITLNINSGTKSRAKTLKKVTGKDLNTVTVVSFVNSGMDSAIYGKQQQVRAKMMQALRNEELTLDDQASQPVMFQGRPTTKGDLVLTSDGRQKMESNISRREKLISTAIAMNSVDTHLVARALEKENAWLREQLGKEFV